MGSYNWTRGAAANSENLNLVSSADIAAAYAAHWHNRLAGARATMLDSGLRRFFWRIVHGLDYVLTRVRLRILDAVAGPEPETSADQQREVDRERIERASPKIEP